jgi:chromosomal replication initiation ATPase DnaA
MDNLKIDIESLKKDFENYLNSISMVKYNRFIISNSKITCKHFNKNFEQIACDIFGVTPALIKTGYRGQKSVWCKYFIFNYLKENTTLSLTAIGNQFKRDHSQVIHAVKKHNELLLDKKYRELHEKFIKNLK